MSIVATYVVFNEAELIAESIRSVKAYVDRFVVVDSAFTSNPTEATHSTDDTRQIAEHAAHPLPILYLEADRKLRLDEARNLSLSFLESDDWALIIDGDETLLGERTEARELFGEIRRRQVNRPIGVNVYTSALVFNGHAPDIPESEYDTLPVIHTRGVQARLIPSPGMAWKRVPNGQTYGLYHDGGLVKHPEIDPRICLINHRTRQTYEAYQLDYAWETAERAA